MSQFISNKAAIGKILMRARPDATAVIRGSRAYPELRGSASFYETPRGVIVTVEAAGLPQPEGVCSYPIFAVHIHEGVRCAGNAEDPFAEAGSHYNPENCPHPGHAGDLPPLFGNDGYGWYGVLTDRFRVRDVIGRTIVIHSGRDDFTTQPAGDSGSRIACGVIR